MDNKQRQEIETMIKLAVNHEISNQGLLTREELHDAVEQSINKTLSTTLRLMGVKFKDNGDIDFEHAHDNNEYVTRLRRGHNQVVKILFNSCLATAAIAFITMVGTSIVEHIRAILHSPTP